MNERSEFQAETAAATAFIGSLIMRLKINNVGSHWFRKCRFQKNYVIWSRSCDEFFFPSLAFFFLLSPLPSPSITLGLNITTASTCPIRRELCYLSLGCRAYFFRLLVVVNNPFTQKGVSKTVFPTFKVWLSPHILKIQGQTFLHINLRAWQHPAVRFERLPVETQIHEVNIFPLS